MHELAVTKSILRLVLEAAQKINAKEVKAICLVVGEMRNLEQSWIQRYFDYISKNSIAEGANIQVKKIPVVFGCRECGKEFTVNLHENKKIFCLYCSGDDYTLLTGQELLVDNMEVIYD